jgi:hypothetical protein
MRSLLLERGNVFLRQITSDPLQGRMEPNKFHNHSLGNGRDCIFHAQALEFLAILPHEIDLRILPLIHIQKRPHAIPFLVANHPEWVRRGSQHCETENRL